MTARLSLATALAAAWFTTGSVATIAIDVHVIVTQSGDAVPDLRAEDFAVTLDGVEQPVAAAKYVTAPETFILAVDQTSFRPSAVPAARELAGRVLDRLGPAHPLGLAAYPDGVSVPATTNRQPIRAALGRIAGLWSDTPADKRAARSIGGL